MTYQHMYISGTAYREERYIRKLQNRGNQWVVSYPQRLIRWLQAGSPAPAIFISTPEQGVE